MRAIGWSIRTLLLLTVILIVGWAFFDVGRRVATRWSEARERPVELTVMHWGDPAEDKIVSDLVATFQRENPQVRVVRINAGGEFRNKIKTMMSAGSAPDVFYLPPEMMPELAQMKLIAPLDRHFDQEPADWKNDFYPILLRAMRFDTATGQLGEGALYGLPKDFTTAVFYINVDLFEKAGVDWKRIQREGWTWNEFEDHMKKITALQRDLPTDQRRLYGANFEIWPDTLRNILWTFDGEFFKRKADGRVDFQNLALTEPGSQQALEMLARMRLKDRTAFNATGIAKDATQEFLTGSIGCVGPIGRWRVPLFKSITAFKWDVVPVPAGTQRASQIFYNGWGMSQSTRHPTEAYKLIRFLCGREGQVQQGRAGLAIPALQSVAQSADFLSPNGTGIPPHNSQAFLDAIPFARIGQVPREAEFSRIVEQVTSEAIQSGRRTPMDAAEEVQRRWSSELSSPLRKQQWSTMPWGTILTIAGILGATIVLVLALKARREKLGPLDRATERSGFMFILPWIIGFVLLTLGPMITSLLLAFSQWTGLIPLAEAKYVGIANFKQLVTYDPTFIQSLKVTAYYVVLGVPLSQLAALAIAMLMNSRVRGITAFRTIYFVPSVVSGVALSMLWLQLFNNDYGLINTILRATLHPIGWTTIVLAIVLASLGMLLLSGMLRSMRRGANLVPTQGVMPGVLMGAGGTLLILGAILVLRNISGPNPPNWFGVDTSATPPVNDAARWAIPGFVLMSLWGVGGGMIIYLAGLKGIPVSLYEAARIDGAGAWRQFRNVTLPMLSPLIFYNLVMAIIGSFQVFTQAYTMTGAGPENATLFYVLQLYRQAFEFHNMGYASAMAWVLFVIVLVLTALVFKGSKNLVYYEGLKS